MTKADYKVADYEPAEYGAVVVQADCYVVGYERLDNGDIWITEAVGPVNYTHGFRDPYEIINDEPSRGKRIQNAARLLAVMRGEA